MPRKRLLVFAYACEPSRGSEPEAGWLWVRAMAKSAETWVITRANNRDVIDEALASEDSPELKFVYVDLPPKWAFWKKGKRGARLYYVLWQLAAARVGRRMAKANPFDAVWHLTLANAWLGSGAALIPGRFIYGPVGGCVDPPVGLLVGLGPVGLLYELGRYLSRTTARYLNPLARLAWRRAAVIVAQNPETRAWFPRRHRRRTLIYQNASIMLASQASTSHPFTHTAVYAGRLLAFKGVWLSIRAIARTREWRLIVLGSGPDEPRLRRLATRLGVAARVEFRGWVSREKSFRALREEADVLLYPSLHDESPLAVAEAVSQGVPVICFDRGGAPLLARNLGIPIHATTPKATAARLAAALELLDEPDVRGEILPLSDWRPVESLIEQLLAGSEETPPWRTTAQ